MKKMPPAQPWRALPTPLPLSQQGKEKLTNVSDSDGCVMGGGKQGMCGKSRNGERATRRGENPLSKWDPAASTVMTEWRQLVKSLTLFRD